jgi:hypothetical protein
MNARLWCLSRCAVSCIALGTASSTSWAADYPKEGSLDVNYCFVGEAHHFQPTEALSYGAALNHAVAFSNKPSGPFDYYGSTCVVVYNTNKNGRSAANGHCEQTDADGHKWFSSFNDDGNKMSGTFEATGGTGKYEGLKLAGEFKPNGPLFFGTPGHIMRCMKVTGTYKLR